MTKEMLCADIDMMSKAVGPTYTAGLGDMVDIVVSANREPTTVMAVMIHAIMIAVKHGLYLDSVSIRGKEHVYTLTKKRT